MNRNRQVADKICNSLRAENQVFHLGEWVALLDGKVVATTDSLANAIQALRAIDPDPARGMLVEAIPPVVDVIR